METLFIIFIVKSLQKEQNSTNYYYDPQSAGINMQSPQSDLTPWTLTLVQPLWIKFQFLSSTRRLEYSQFGSSLQLSLALFYSHRSSFNGNERLHRVPQKFGQLFAKLPKTQESQTTFWSAGRTLRSIGKIQTTVRSLYAYSQKVLAKKSEKLL